MEERQKRVADTCQSYAAAAKLKPLPASSFTVDYEHKVGYCRIPKVASTSLLSYFLLINSNLTNKTKSTLLNNIYALHKNIRKIFPNQKTFSFIGNQTQDLRENKIVTFSFVRHPFER